MGVDEKQLVISYISEKETPITLSFFSTSAFTL